VLSLPTPGGRLRTVWPWLGTIIRLVLAAVLIVAGWPKFVDVEGTVRSVAAFRLLPQDLVRPFAYALPAFELVLALLLILGIGTRLLGVAYAALMVMFLFGIASAWARGLRIDCGCFGNAGQVVPDPVPGYIRDIVRDVGLLLGALWLVVWPYTRLALDSLLGLTHPSVDPSSSDLPDPAHPGAHR
jgi:uncharacterized membrane protein YphA (DoxX/SURF4 family)